MRKIDITTSQNVTIEYELATVKERISSTLIDMIIIYIGSLLSYGLLVLLTGMGKSFNYIIITIPGSFFYHLLFESLNHGQTLGKKALKIRVVKITGERPVFFDFMMRTVFRVIDIASTLGTLALITISSSGRGQRVGDFFADTTVVRLMNFNSFSLNRILSMEKLKNYTPKYPNDSHINALSLLVKKIEGQLGIVAPPDKIIFLNTLIKDYVSLTR
jgi:uncharacterized RDD family membrane protein YckC